MVSNPDQTLRNHHNDWSKITGEESGGWVKCEDVIIVKPQYTTILE